ncbi:MAG: response regulator [Chloroflexi bacterium]|nr:MAG: response regulator [Chloroflexota bacterium]
MQQKILIVDDAKFMRVRCARILTDRGFLVIEAESGIQAIEKYQSESPDAVLMDISMPGMDGLNALRAIRELDPSARVAMLTAMGQQNVVIEAIKAGARDFIVKPFEPDRVLRSLSKLLM